MKAQSKAPKAGKTPGKAQGNQSQASSAAEGDVPGQQAGQTQQGNAEALLKTDHRKVEGLFQKFKSATSPSQKSQLVEQICDELQIHTKIEEEIFYPACREKGVTDSTLDEAQVEHDGAKVLINDLKEEEPDSDYYDAKVTVLSEYIKHHVGEEEKPGDGIFAKAQAAGVDMEALGRKILARKAELMARVEQGRLPPSSPRSLQLDHSMQASNKENEQMPRNRRYEDEEDDRRGSSRGRGGMGYSREDDDHRQGGRYGSQGRDEDGRFSGEGGNGGRYGSQNRERDDQGRFMSDDDNNDYRRGSSNQRSRDDEGRYSSEGGYGGRSGSQDRDRDERGRFTGDDGDDGRSSRSRYRDDDEGRENGGYGRSSRNYGRERDDDGRYSGESGRSSRSGSQDRERDDHGRFMGNDDDDRRSGGRSSSSSSPSRGGSRGGDHDHGGWYGDSRGHSQAAKRGWQHRG